MGIWGEGGGEGDHNRVGIDIELVSQNLRYDVKTYMA